MSNLSIEVADDLAGILGEVQQPIGTAALELIVLELYRRGKVSSGRAAELLGMSRLARGGSGGRADVGDPRGEKRRRGEGTRRRRAWRAAPSCARAMMLLVGNGPRTPSAIPTASAGWVSAWR